ncbi:alpha/beta hydrolase [Brevibacillus migulae]|uniref:alpha/beta hydrolase n=1 Tax=Brevibacillus migulae TaxID=1644114 RepID=UPI001430C3A5|nr:prolyl oligopeptidase family serine peptidase [Brevibacillus migulae]
MWLCSAGGPTALTALLQTVPEWLTCVAAYYPLMDMYGLASELPDLSPETVRQYSAMNHLKSNPANVPPMLVVKAGLDRPFFNDSIDRFMQEATNQRIPVELVTHPDGQHAFDLFNDDEVSRKIIRNTLSFFKLHLETAPAGK